MTISAFRRNFACFTLLGLAALCMPAAAPAAPTITSVKLQALPIPGVPETGNVLGAGAVFKGQLAISGTEYAGSPSPLTGARLYAPAGTKLHPQGFATCAPRVLEQSGPGSCPKRSIAGPKGHAVGVVSFGGERVPESATVQPFFAPDGKLTAFVDGTTPTLVEVLGTGYFVNAAPPFGLEFIGQLPLIETVPEAPDASFLEGAVEVGASYKQGKKTISYITMPKTCPKHGWPTKIELSFLSGETAIASYEMPCPKR